MCFRAIFKFRRTPALLLISLFLGMQARGQTITLSLTNETIEKAFRDIEAQCRYRFVYEQERLREARPVTVKVERAPLLKALDLLFLNQPLSYAIEDNYIMVKGKEFLPNAELKNINGTVKDENGQPVPYATIRVKGSGKLTSTNEQGRFTLEALPGDAVLQISSIGFNALEVAAGNGKELDIRMLFAVTTLDEAVIKGYYTTSKRLNTGSVARLTATEIAKQPVTSPLQALQGRMTGVLITQGTGLPGSAYTVRIRGRNSLRATANDPLYVVDGVPFTPFSTASAVASQIIPSSNPLNLLNPADIESIEVLKDADATAIYGSRGANGVILISTKRGKRGETRVDFNMYKGFGQVPHFMKLLHTTDYVAMRKEAFANDATAMTTANAADLLLWDTGRFTDWQRLLLGGKAAITDAQVSVSGGNAHTQFLFGTGYHREGTVFPGSFNYQRLSGRLQLTHQSANEKLKLQVSGSYAADQNNLPRQDLSAPALRLPPNAPAVYGADGQLNWENGTWTNPFSLLVQPYKGRNGNLVANVLAWYTVLKGLQLKISAGFTQLQLYEFSGVPVASVSPTAGATSGAASFGTANARSWIAEPSAEYQVVLGKGKLTALAGLSFQQTVQDGQTLSATGFSSDALLEDIKAAGTITATGSNQSVYRYNAVFARLHYAWQDRYLLNITGRRDGSSRFGPGRQFANFGAVGAGWIFTGERFTKQLQFLSFGKLRCSYGITGSDQIADYGYLDTYSSTALPYFGMAGLVPTRLVNPDYAWETNVKMEAAIELGFFGDRLLASFAYYRNRSSNQLVGYSLPVITGQPSVQYNLPATVENTGYETELNTTPIRTENFEWAAGLQLTLPRNRLVAYPGLENSSAANTLVVGQSLFIQKRYQNHGVDPTSGMYVIEDVNKDGVISVSGDAKVIREVSQTAYGGFQNRFSYKGLSLDVFFQFVKQTARDMSSAFGIPGTNINQPLYVMERWQKPGDQNTVQKFTRGSNATAVSAYLNASMDQNSIVNASFARLKNLSLAYKLPEAWRRKLKMQQARVYVQGQNLWTKSGYDGLDPETAGAAAVPPLRVVTAGFQFIF